MAAPRSTSQRQGSDSSSGDEDLERFREAAWEPPGSVKNTVRFSESSASPVAPSLRVQPDSYDHRGNELQTTPEFRSHVAKKLTAILDSCIKEIPGSSRFIQESTAASDSEDEGFRLLTTSVPGNSGKILPSPALKRRVKSSTSDDSEEENQRRCKEAAVSGFDILRHSALHTTVVEIMDTASNNQIKKKKKKKKAKMERREPSDESDDQNMKLEGKINGFKKKKKNMKIGLSDEAKTDDHNLEPEGKMSGFKKKKEKGMSDETQPHDQNMEPEGKMKRFKKKKKKMQELSDETETNDQVMEPEGKINELKKSKERRSNETQSDEQTIHLESENKSKKNKTGSDQCDKSETVKGRSKKENKEMGFSEISSDQNTNSMCGKSRTKKKKKRGIEEHCAEHD